MGPLQLTIRQQAIAWIIEEMDHWCSNASPVDYMSYRLCENITVHFFCLTFHFHNLKFPPDPDPGLAVYPPNGIRSSATRDGRRAKETRPGSGCMDVKLLVHEDLFLIILIPRINSGCILMNYHAHPFCIIGPVCDICIYMQYVDTFMHVCMYAIPSMAHRGNRIHLYNTCFLWFI